MPALKVPYLLNYTIREKDVSFERKYGAATVESRNECLVYQQR